MQPLLLLLLLLVPPDWAQLGEGGQGAAPEAEAALSNGRDAKRATPKSKRESRLHRAAHAPFPQIR